MKILLTYLKNTRTDDCASPTLLLKASANIVSIRVMLGVSTSLIFQTKYSKAEIS